MKTQRKRRDDSAINRDYYGGQKLLSRKSQHCRRTFTWWGKSRARLNNTSGARHIANALSLKMAA
jgi:hypothetical protein